MLQAIFQLLDEINVKSEDNGEVFTATDRLERIQALLNESPYKPLKENGVACIYAREDFNPTRSFMLISCHIDSLYDNYFHQEYDHRQLLGTFDNSISNAVLLRLMLQGALPSNVLITLTGDEEEDSRGARETIQYLRETTWIDQLELVITLDITAAGYDTDDYTIENLYVTDGLQRNTLLQFSTLNKLENYVRSVLHEKCTIIPYSDADESWEYEWLSQTGFTLCIPTRPHPANAKEIPECWMHADEGILVRKQAIEGFSNALVELCLAASRVLEGN